MSIRANKLKVSLAFSRRFNPPVVWTSEIDWWRHAKREKIVLSEPAFIRFMEMVERSPALNEKLKALLQSKDVPWKK